ncbi:MAG: DUF63 family protein [Nanoarchaeota archaeon]
MAGFYDWFVEPMLQNGWYNPINTITYSLILIVAVFLVYKMLKKMNIHIDKHFFIAILPFIFWGSSTRVLKDAATAGALMTPELNAIYGAPFFVTPGSYIITFALALLVLLLSLLVQKLSHAKLPYWKAMFGAGVVLCALNVYLLPIMALEGFPIVISLTLLWTLLFFGKYRFYRTGFFERNFSKLKPDKIKKFWNKQNAGIMSAHMLDASATFVALSMFGYLEQHVVPRLLINFMGPASMFLLKLVVVIPVLYIIDRYAEDGDFKNFLKIVVLILGLAPGMRDALRLLVMV